MQIWQYVVAALVALAVGAVVLLVMWRHRGSRGTVEGTPDAGGSVAGPGADEHEPAVVTPADALTAQPQAPPAEVRDAADALVDAEEPIAAPWLTPDFANDGRRTVLAGARVLVCADAVAGSRELWAALGQSQQRGEALVVVAPDLAEEAALLLIINHRVGQVSALAVVAEDPVRDEIAAALGVEQSTATDRQAGYLPEEHWGRAELWVSDRRHTWFRPAR